MLKIREINCLHQRSGKRTNGAWYLAEWVHGCTVTGLRGRSYWRYGGGEVALVEERTWEHEEQTWEQHVDRA